VVQQPEGEEEVLVIVSRHRRRFTVCQLVQLLRGAKSYSALRAHLPAFGEFGRLADWQEEEIEEALETLRRAGKIRVLKRGFWKDRITMESVS
jgi:hypothetical protein